MKHSVTYIKKRTGSLIRQIFKFTLISCSIMIALNNAHAEQITVMASVAFKEPYLKMVEQFEKKGHVVKTDWLPTVEIVKRIKSYDSSELGDLVIIDGKNIDALISLGKLRAGSKVEYVSSGIGIGVSKGAIRPVLNNKEDLKKFLLSTDSLAYSTGPSGTYLAGLFEQLGIAEQIKSKTKIIQGEPVGNAVKRGEVQTAFQQIPEILSVPEIDFVGPLPEDIQYVTTFAFATPNSVAPKPIVQEFIKWLKSPQGVMDIKAHGLEPK